MIELQVAEGVHRVEHAFVNWYVIADGASLTVVDTGLPRSWRLLEQLVDRLGRRLGDIEAVVVTHGHFDHMGFAERARRELGVPLLAPRRDLGLVAHPWRYRHERPRVAYALRHPRFVGMFAAMAAAGALWVKGSTSARAFEGGDVLDVPGRPTAIATPGHTDGHCSLLLRDRGVLLAGDAVVTADPYTGGAGPEVVARAATADSGLAVRSLGAIAATGAQVVLTGHGPPWRLGAAALVEAAVAAGVP